MRAATSADPTYRIEAAENGVRLNTDTIDNSLGVDTSDHEVNIRSCSTGSLQDGDLTVKQRNDCSPP